MQFRVFFIVKVHNGGYFWGLLKFLIFLGVFKIPEFFWGVKGRCLARAYK